MRYAIFTDIHANLEALEAVLARIDEIAKDEPIDQLWFLGDLVGYGPDPNECIRILRERTDVIIAGNHDWAAVGKIDLEDFSAAARISAEWTAEQLTPEYRDFLINLPERLEIGECTLVHGSPFGPLWEYLTSEALAERSFLYFNTHYCLVGHTHVPVIFIQPDAANVPTLPLNNSEQADTAKPADSATPASANGSSNHHEHSGDESAVDHTTPVDALIASDNSAIIEASDDDETVELVTVQQQSHQSAETRVELSAFVEQNNGDAVIAADTDADTSDDDGDDETETAIVSLASSAIGNVEGEIAPGNEEGQPAGDLNENKSAEEEEGNDYVARATASAIASTEVRLNEIEELLNLLGLSQSMVEVTNQMLTPPVGHWEMPSEHRAIINPGGVGQPRDGDPRAAFMIYDTERGFEFYRVPYDIEKTQEKIIAAGLPEFLAARLSYGR